MQYIIYCMICLLLISIFLLQVNASWTVTGYKPSYQINYNSIVAHDTLIDIVSRLNKSDKNRWYFRSPPIYQIPKLLAFTLSSRMGKYNILNNNLEPVVLSDSNHRYVFPHIHFNGSTTQYMVQFISQLWNPILPPKLNTPIYINILGDWTQGNETVVLSNVKIY